MFIIHLQTARGILKSVICIAHFSDNFNSVFSKKIEKRICLCSIAHKKRKNRFDT